MPSRRSQQASAASRSRASNNGPATLPTYEPLHAPLTAQSQAALDTLTRSQNTQALNEHFKKVNEELSQSVYNIHESLANQEYWLQGRLEKAGGEDAKYKSRIAAVESLAERTKEMSAMLEVKMREAIDAQAKAKLQQDVLREVSGNVSAARGRVVVAATQSTLGASQFRGRVGEDQDENDGEEAAGVTLSVGKKLREHDERYAQLSMAERYAEHNDYIAFRRSLHDGKYAPHDGQQPLLPHASTWFDADGPVFPEAGRNEDSTQTNNHEDSDIEAVAENISLRCPISLKDMTNPVKSLKCPHYFQKESIEQMLRDSPLRVPGASRRSAYAVKCPVCNVVLTEADLVPDQTLKRRIERRLATQARNENDTDDDDDEDRDGSAARRAQTVDSQFEPNLDHLTQVKAEARSGAARRSVAPATQKREEDDEGGLTVPMSTAEVVDLDMTDSDEDE